MSGYRWILCVCNGTRFYKTTTKTVPWKNKTAAKLTHKIEEVKYKRTVLRSRGCLSEVSSHIRSKVETICYAVYHLYANI